MQAEDARKRVKDVKDVEISKEYVDLISFYEFPRLSRLSRVYVRLLLTSFTSLTSFTCLCTSQAHAVLARAGTHAHNCPHAQTREHPCVTRTRRTHARTRARTHARPPHISQSLCALLTQNRLQIGMLRCMKSSSYGSGAFRCQWLSGFPTFPAVADALPGLS